MRTVHEPEPPKASATNANPIDPLTGQPKKGPKIRLTANGGKSGSADPAATAKHADKNPANAGLDPSHPDYDPSPPNDNIQYIPAYHPTTGQPGFMITYPPDTQFTQFESEIPADQLMRLLRRQLHWAQQEAEELQRDCERLQCLRQEEWVKKEVLLEGAMSGELAYAESQGLLAEMKGHEKAQMESDIHTAKDLRWTKAPWWKSGEEWAWKKRQADGLDHGDGVRQDVDEPDDGVEDDVDERMSYTKHGVSRTQKEQEDDAMMAVGALMGLSAGETAH